MRKYAKHSDHSSKQRALYDLYGVSHHSGSLSGGHYVCDVKNVAEGKWYRCNDSHVSSIASPDTSSSSAYVLFYVMRED